MRLSRRDVLATVLVLAGGAVYVLWLTSHPVPGVSSPRVVAFIVFGTGVAASASAVVPSFLSLLRGSKMYLVAASLIGAAAMVAGVVAVARQTDAMLGMLVALTAVLWIMATIRHTIMNPRDRARSAPRATTP
jgi:hypothetical protein